MKNIEVTRLACQLSLQPTFAELQAALNRAYDLGKLEGIKECTEKVSSLKEKAEKLRDTFRTE